VNSETNRRPGFPLDGHWPVLCLIAAGLTLVVTWPLWLHLTTRQGGWGGDNYMFAWNLWWVPHALSGGQPVYHCPDILIPFGANLAFHTLTPASGLVASPITAAWGVLPAFNILLLASFPVAFVCAWYFARQQGVPLTGAIAAGVIFGFCPYKTAQGLAHFNMAHTFGLPLTAMAAESVMRHRTKTAGVLLAAALALTTYFAMVYGLLAGLLAGFIIAGRWLCSPRKWDWNLAASGAAAWIMLAALLAPLLLEMREETIREGQFYINPVEGAIANSGDPISFITPPVFSTIWGRAPGLRPDGSRETWIDLRSLWRTPWNQQVLFTGDIFEGTLFMGYSALLLTAIGAVIAWRKPNQRLWLLLLAAAAVLSLGPFLHVNGQFEFGVGRIPLPFRLLQYIPTFNLLRMPARFHVITMLAASLLAGWAISTVRRARGGAWLAPALIVVIAAEYLPLPYPTVEMYVPRHVQLLAELPAGTVLDLPPGWRSGTYVEGTERTIFQYYQTIHHHPIIAGHVSRLPQRYIRYYHHIPIIEELYRLGMNGLEPPESTAGIREQAQVVSQLWDVRYIAIHRRALLHHVVEPTVPSDRIDRLISFVEAVFPVTKLHEDGDSAFYIRDESRILPLTELSFGTNAARVALLSGWIEDGGGIVWAEGERSEILLPRAPPDATGLRFEARPYGPDHRQVTATLDIGQGTEAEICISGGWRIYQVPLPVSGVCSRPVTLTLRHSSAITPASLGVSSSRQKFAVGYRSIGWF